MTTSCKVREVDYYKDWKHGYILLPSDVKRHRLLVHVQQEHTHIKPLGMGDSTWEGSLEPIVGTLVRNVLSSTPRPTKCAGPGKYEHWFGMVRF